MKFAAGLFLSSAAVVGAVTTAPCNNDNCLRAIRAINFPLRSGLADCNSYFRTTVTPRASISYVEEQSTTYDHTEVQTVTSTVTITTATSTITPAGTPHAKRDVSCGPNTPKTSTATAIPTYATACSGSVRYSSACSCVGATHGITTLPTPVKVLTATVYITVPTLTTTTTVTETTTQKIVATGFALKVVDGINTGKFIYVENTSNPGATVGLTIAGNPGVPPAIFSLTPSGALSIGARDLYMLKDAGNLPPHASDVRAITPNTSHLLLSCSINSTTKALACSNGDFGKFVACPGGGLKYGKTASSTLNYCVGGVTVNFVAVYNF